MIDDELQAGYEALAPSPEQRRRMETRVGEWLEAHDTSLAAEWLHFVRVSPLSALGLGAVSAASMAAAPPFVWLARALF